MSPSCSPESATASLTAVSAWAASGISAERVTLEKPTPLTATLHRFSHMRLFPSLALDRGRYGDCRRGGSPPPNPPPSRGRARKGSALHSLPLDGGGVGWGGRGTDPRERNMREGECVL